MTEFVCAACRKPATEDNKVREECGRLIHSKGCNYRAPDVKTRCACKRCGIDVYMVNPVLALSTMYVQGARTYEAYYGPANDCLCAYCVVALYGRSKALDLLMPKDPAARSAVPQPVLPGHDAQLLKVVEAWSFPMVSVSAGTVDSSSNGSSGSGLTIGIVTTT